MEVLDRHVMSARGFILLVDHSVKNCGNRVEAQDGSCIDVGRWLMQFGKKNVASLVLWLLTLCLVWLRSLCFAGRSVRWASCGLAIVFALLGVSLLQSGIWFGFVR